MKNIRRGNPGRPRQALDKKEIREAVIIIAAGILMFIAASFLNLHNLLDKWSKSHEFGFFRFDEFLVVFSVLMFLVSIFYLRRWKELKLEILKRKEAEAKLSRLNASLKMISQCNQLMVRARDEEELLAQLCRIIIDFGGYRMCWVGFLKDDDKLRLAASAGNERGYLAVLQAISSGDRLNSGFIGEAVRTARPSVNRNTRREPGNALWKLEALKRGYLSSVALPLLIDNKLIGLLNIYSEQPDIFDIDEVDLLMQLADDLTFGIVSLRARFERNKATEALRQARDNLEIRVQKRTFELSKSNVELQEQIVKARNAEGEIRALNKQIEYILGVTRTGLDIIDADYNVRYVDPAWAKIYGDFKGKKCYEYFMGRDKACPECGIRKAMETKKPVVTEEILAKEGNRPIEVTTLPYQDDEGNWLVAEINVDVSERKRQEALLKENEERYRQLIDISPDLISLIDLNGRILMVNSFGAQLYGYASQQEAIGMNIFDFIAPEQHKQVRKDIARLINCGSLVGLEYLTFKKDKSPLYVEASISLLKDQNGVPQSIVMIIRDISKRKK